ncbi:cytochrome c peroxidase [Luteirhabdus pelagi]|uniref:cytochrome c peroxidase n=1 Tax=Luteirhabdus pelagi TaxID=2792783 RepID=UPI00193A5BDC|nr:cytochrome c peroxidase [Luteirhabdus pelagi]
MRTDSLLLLFSLSICGILIWASKHSTPSSTYTAKAIGPINQKFQKELQEFTNETATFKEATVLYSNQTLSEEKLHQKYHQLRQAFKKIEFLVEYLDKEAFDKTLNGAPLPKPEPKVSDFAILQPKGLQVIDELMAEPSADNEALLEMASKLNQDTKKIYAFLKPRKITDRQFFEASRQAIIRLITLGITGFDTPGTLKGVTDASTVLNTQKQYFTFYKKELSNVARPALLTDIQNTIEKGLQQTEKATFEDFNRVTFIQHIGTPIYKNIREIHRALGYETIDEVSKYPLAVNYEAEQLFSKDFLNDFYYVSIPQGDTFDDLAALGKLLFYDPVLSNDNKMSCASCHKPEKAFTDGLATSLSNNGKPLKRNSMTLNYSVYASGFFHDLRAKRLEDQFEHVVLNPEEFNSEYRAIMEKLNESDTYRQLFQKAFPNQPNPIKSHTIDYALTTYVMKLNSFDSKIDQFFQGEIEALSASEERGFNLFAGKAACATCHFIPTFSGLVPPLYVDTESEVLGVPDTTESPAIDDDLGRVNNGSTREVAPFYAHSFKTPTLRNINKTGPYMHNGVFNTLEEVMDFYNEGGGAGRGAEIPHQTLAADALDLTEEEISNIIAFMKALSDTSEVTPPDSLPRDFSEKNINSRKLLK